MVGVGGNDMPYVVVEKIRMSETSARKRNKAETATKNESICVETRKMAGQG